MSRPLLLLIASLSLFAQQSELSGLIKDASGATISQASIDATESATNLRFQTTSSESGLYRFPPLPPGRYTLKATAQGFDTHTINDLNLAVGAKLSLDITLKVGNISQTVTVDGSGIQLNTVNANVSTLIDRQFVENIPLNGRSFQSLLTLAPGVAAVPSQGGNRGGEITVNGQRAEANYFVVDGVSANTGAGAGVPGYGAGYSGSVPGQTILGTTQSLVSVDALQEFRATTSTYSAEYGRTPGGQFSFLTRSGTNAFHGSLFNYFRNDVLDANNFFSNRAGLPKSRNRQNNFGGTIGGPILKDRTFFFLSYEALRLRSPQAAIITDVPSLSTRALASNAALKAVLNAFPLPTGAERADGLAPFVSGYSSPSSLNTTSFRVDHRFTDRFTVFGRYSDSPSDSLTRQTYNLAQLTSLKSGVRTATFGATNMFNARWSNDARFNFTHNSAGSVHTIDNFGGATPLAPSDLPSSMPGMTDGSWLYWVLNYGLRPAIRFFPADNVQRQFNVTNSTSATLGRHTLKFGIDYRRLMTDSPLAYTYQTGGFYSLDKLRTNSTDLLSIYRAGINMKPVYTNFSAFVQDEWRATERLSLSLGMRWDVNPAPQDAGSSQPYGITSTDLKTTMLAPRERALWATTWGNFAPRIGIAYQLRRTPGSETVIRTGTGLFFDTGNSESARGYWYATGVSQRVVYANLPFPLTQSQLDAVPPPSTATPYQMIVFGYDPKLKLPYAWQWNLSVEQSLGTHQTLTVGYLGSAGRRLTAQRQYYPDRLGNANFGPAFGLTLVENAGKSDYNALQVQLQRKLSRGLQGLVSYTWSHALDNSTSNFLIYQLQRASSDFDIRQNLQAAITYDLPGRYQSSFANNLLGNWSIDSRISARTALPVDVLGGIRIDGGSGQNVQFHPNYVPGQPLYINDVNSPGGRRINIDAFATVPAGVEGNIGRNIARAFGTTQTDFTLRKDFALTERFRLQFRAEAFNIFNRANFGTVFSTLTDGRANFGNASNTQNTQLGNLNSLYQVGGPRSIQLALKLRF